MADPSFLLADPQILKRTRRRDGCCSWGTCGKVFAFFGLSSFVLSILTMRARTSQPEDPNNMMLMRPTHLAAAGLPRTNLRAYTALVPGLNVHAGHAGRSSLSPFFACSEYPDGRIRQASRAEGASSASEAESGTKVSKSEHIMRKFSQAYAKNTGTYFCEDKSVAASVIKGLAQHQDELGAPLCPCRHYQDKKLEAKNGYWNCPCVPMRERHECHCMLFLTEDNPFAGKEQTLSEEEMLDAMKGN